MSKSYWMKEQKGNFSNAKEDTFDPKNRYVGIRLQQGVPLLDRDWNELEDIRRYEELMLRKWYVGNGTPDDGFKISVVEPPACDFKIGAGRCIVDGFEVVHEPEGNDYILYSSQDGIANLTLPSEEVRQDTVFLDVWIEEVTSEEDPALKNSQDVKIPTCVRHKLEWRVRVGKENKGNDHHFYYDLAEIKREEGKITEVKDLRTTKLTLATVRDALDTWLTELPGRLDARERKMYRVPLLQQTIFGRAVPVATIPVGNYPYEVAFDGAHIWVTNYNENSVSKIDIVTNVVATVPVGTNPRGVAFDGVHIWVANSGEDTVSKIDIVTNAVVATVSVGDNPRGVAFDGTHIWVINFNDNSVSKVDIATNAMVETVSVGEKPRGVAFDGMHILVANFNGNSVSKVDIHTNEVVATVSVGEKPRRVVFDGTHIWVTNSGENTLSKVDIQTNEVVATVSVGESPRGVAFDGAHIWIVNSDDNNISKIDILTNEVIKKIPVGKKPGGVAFDGTHIWVANSEDNSVTKILRGDLK
jgi:YVTN family beta-propeller protein